MRFPVANFQSPPLRKLARQKKSHVVGYSPAKKFHTGHRNMGRDSWDNGEWCVINHNDRLYRLPEQTPRRRR